ncbi:Msx2-interacting protein [Trichinella papuae]|uniref:Msx2-interacting protein n=1 Tax=Trichinella papuae TaxID=268474 RepID=A0A0V1MS14_9BILA|nr:Msx2-interacting protein [Trichinella papuae]
MSGVRYFSTFRDSKRINVSNCNESSVSTSKSDTKDVSSLTDNNSESGILLRIDNLPSRLSNDDLKQYIFHQLKSYGIFRWLDVIGNDESRYCLVKYVRDENAISVSKKFPTLNFCGKTASLTIVPQSEDCLDSCSSPLNFEPNARSYASTRTLYLGNLKRCHIKLTEQNLENYFKKFGPVINVDVKSTSTERPYCFVEFSNIKSVVMAIQHVRENGLFGWKDVKANFGSCTVDNKIWITADKCTISYEYATRKFWPYSPHVVDTLVEPSRNQAVIVFDDSEYASIAYQDLKSNPNDDLMMDYCSSLFYDSILERINKGYSDDQPSTRQSEKCEIFFIFINYLSFFLFTFSSSIPPSVDDRSLALEDNNNTDDNDKHSPCDNKLTTKGQNSGMNEHVEDNKQTQSCETLQAKRKAEDHLDVLHNLNDNENCSKDELMKINNSSNKKHCCVENEENCTASAGDNYKAQDTMCCALSPQGNFAADHFRNVTYAMPSGGGNVNATVTGFIPPPDTTAAYYPRPVSNFAIPDGNFVYRNMFLPHFSSTLMHPYWTVPQIQKFPHILPVFYPNGERLPEEAVTVTTTLSASTLQGIYEYLARKNRSYFVFMTRNLSFFVERNVNFSTYEGINFVAQSYLYYPIVWFAKTSFRDVSCEIAFRCIFGNFLVVSQVLSALDERTARSPRYRMASVIIEEMKPLKEASKVFFQGNDSAIAILRTDCFELEIQAAMGGHFLRNLVNPMISQGLVGFCSTEEFSENQSKFVVHFIPPLEFVRQHLFEQYPTAYATLHLNIANYLVCVISTVDNNMGRSGNAAQAED